MARPEPTPKSWRKPRYISVAEAVTRLQPNVDVPVILPRDRLAGIRSFKWWMADPKQLDWGRVAGVRAGSMQLVRNKQILILDYGYSSFDGCGGRDTAVETNVAGQPALLSTMARDEWSTLIWPVTTTGNTGTYGLHGTFEDWEMIRLAESMDAARAGGPAEDQGC